MVDGNFLKVVAISEKYKLFHITTSHLGMVSVGAGAKRHSEDETLVQESDMKKPRVQQGDSQGQAGEGQGAGKLTANEELKVRIKKYLEENRSLKYIDVEKMSHSLHDKYPDYRRKKLKVFKNQVEFAFKSLTDEMVAKKKDKKKNTKADEKLVIEEIRVEEDDEDETTVKGTSMNSRLSSLYSDQKSQNGAAEATEAAASIDNDDCQVIDDDVIDEQNETNEAQPQYSETTTLQQSLSEFEKTKNKIKEFSEKFEQQLESSQGRRAKTPSKSLSAYLNNSKSIENSFNPSSPVCNNSYEDMLLASTERRTMSPIHSVSKSPVKSLSSKSNKRPEPVEEISINDDEIENAIINQKSTSKKKATDTTSSSVKKRKKLEVSVTSSSLTFADFGGNEEVLRNICKLLVHLKHPEVFMKLGVTPLR